MTAFFSAFPTSATGLSTTTDANGGYTITLPAGARAPFALQAGNDSFSSVNPAFPRLTSYSARAGTVNITPLTDLLVTRLVDQRQSVFGDAIALANLTLTDQQIATATQQVKTYLQSRSTPVNASAVGDFVSTPFTPAAGNPYDDAMTALKQSLVAGESLLGIEEHMLGASDAQADYSLLFPLAFTANCVASQGGLPSGSTQIDLQSTGITIGSSLTHPFAAGDQVSVITGTDELWSFLLNTGEQVELTRNSTGTLSTLKLIASGATGSSLCTPSSAVSLAGKWPSIFAQVKRLASTMTGSITCTGGANTLTIDANGAVHAAPSGFTLSLISSNRAGATSDISVSGATFSTQMRSFSTVQAFGNTSDTFSVRLANPGGTLSNGSVTGAFTRVRGSVTTGC